MAAAARSSARARAASLGNSLACEAEVGDLFLLYYTSNVIWCNIQRSPAGRCSNDMYALLLFLLLYIS